MIKPILYQSFEEKELLEKELMAEVSPKKREILSRALMDIFHKAKKVEQPNQTKKEKSTK